MRRFHYDHLGGVHTPHVCRRPFVRTSYPASLHTFRANLELSHVLGWPVLSKQI